MNRLLLLILPYIIFSTESFAQANMLFIKKGVKKKRSYTYGSRMDFELVDGNRVKGIITELRNDSIFLNGIPVPARSVRAVILNEKKKKPFPVDGKTALLIGGGAALTTAGLTLSKQAEPGEAIIASLAIGYAPLLIRFFFGRLLYTITRKKFRIGKKYRLQVFDVYIPRSKGF